MEIRVEKLENRQETYEASLNTKINALSVSNNSMETTLRGVHDHLLDLKLTMDILSETSYDGEFVWKVPNLDSRFKKALYLDTLSIYSAPFFSSRLGYTMCLRLYLNGDGEGKYTHLSYFFVLMRGEYDNLLEWPFAKIVSMSILNQSGGKDISETFTPNDSNSFQRPQREMNIATGFPQFTLSMNTDN